MKAMLNKYKWSTLVIGIVLVLVGFTTVLLSAMALSGQGSIDVTGMIRYTLGGSLVTIGAFMFITSIVKEPKKPDVSALIPAALLMGCGCFLMLKDGLNFTTNIVTRCLPLLMVYIGIAVLIKTIVYLAKTKKERDGKFWIVALACGVIITALGWCFMLIDSMNAYIWLLVSGVILAVGVLLTIKGAKKLK